MMMVILRNTNTGSLSGVLFRGVIQKELDRKDKVGL